MAELPDHVKAKADAAVSQTDAGRFPVKDMGETKGADWADTKALDAQRAQQRQDAAQEKTPAPTVEPDKG